MIKWLRYTFGSFFFNRISKEGGARSFWNVIFGLFFSILILIGFVSVGLNSSINVHYGQASGFQDFVHDIFIDDDNEGYEQLNIQVLETKEKQIDKKITVFYGNNTNNVAFINTIKNEEDKAKYSKNGYDLIIDTRPSESTYVKFDVQVYEIKNPDNKVSFDEYMNFDDNKKKEYNYSMDTITLTDEVITLTDEDIANKRKYIEDTYVPNLNKKDDMLKLWDEIKKVEVTDPNYKNYIYEYYVKAYYKLSKAPTNKLYYQNEFTKTKENGLDLVHEDFLIIMDDWVIGSFETDKKVRVIYDGFYNTLDDGFVIYTSSNQNDAEEVKKQADKFIIAPYKAVNSIRSVMVGMQLFRYMVHIIIALAILALFLFSVCKLRKRDYADRYMAAFKISSSFLLGSATIAGICAFITAFMSTYYATFSIALWSLFSVLCIRVFALVIGEEIKAHKIKKQYVSSNVAPTIDLDGDNKPVDVKESTSIDTNKTSTTPIEGGTKIIKNDDVDDDEFEQMDLMK